MNTIKGTLGDLDYNPATGVMRWLKDISCAHIKKGAIAGTLDGAGYISIGVSGKKMRAHRVAWFKTYGYWPKFEVDHINGNRSDNRIANLREATRRQNGRNCAKPVTNKSGVKGVCWDANRNKWLAQIKFNGRPVHIGRFSLISDAEKAYTATSRSLFGEFHRTTT